MLNTVPLAFLCIEPIPERRAEVEAVVQLLCLDENVGIEEVRHQTTPRWRASSSNVECFLKPSIWYASRWRVWPSRVLSISARANRLLTRTRLRVVEVSAACPTGLFHEG